MVFRKVITAMSAGQYEDLTGCPVLDAEGRTVGTVSQVYVSDGTGQPGWVLVPAGAGNSGDRFAPLAGSEVRGGQLILAVTEQMISDAPWPGLDSDGHMPAAGAGTLAQYYAQAATGTGRAAGDRDADGGLVLSEERLRVGMQRVVSGRARLVKQVVTEEVTLTVLVSHEEVRLELEPAASGDEEPGVGADGELTSRTGNTGSAAGRWMILHAERPVVQMESVPVERVRLRVETVTEQQQITGQVRKERTDTPEVQVIPPGP